MIRTPPAQISGVVLVVEPDEAFNPRDVGVLGPDAFVRRILFRTRSKLTAIAECHRNVLGVRFRPHFFGRGH
jgi:hypothetical protein